MLIALQLKDSYALPPRILGSANSLSNTVHGFTFGNGNGIGYTPIHIFPWADNQ